MADKPGMAGHYAPYDLMQWMSEDCQKAFAEAARIVKMPARRIIYTQLDEGDEMFRLLTGSVRLSVIGPDGRDLLFTFFGPGACFGTSSLVDEELRPQTAEAVDQVELQVIDRAAINRLREGFPEMNDALLRLLSRHMRLLSDYFAGATLDEVACRLAERLVYLGDTFGSAETSVVTLPRHISQTELAAMVGAARQTVNRILRDFQNKGLIAVRPAGVALVDLPALKHIAHSGIRFNDFG